MAFGSNRTDLVRNDYPGRYSWSPEVAGFNVSLEKQAARFNTCRYYLCRLSSVFCANETRISRVSTCKCVRSGRLFLRTYVNLIRPLREMANISPGSHFWPNLAGYFRKPCQFSILVGVMWGGVGGSLGLQPGRQSWMFYLMVENYKGWTINHAKR